MRELAERHGGFSISVDPGAVAASAEAGQAPALGEQVWLEMLADGVTFDLLGLAPGPATERPSCAYSYALEEAATPGVEALTLRPGPHLVGGETMLPVVRSLARLAASLAQCDGVVAVAWHPARSWCGPRPFRDGVLRWTEGGTFSEARLAVLSASADGGLQCEGLALFTGQELRIEPELITDPAGGEALGAGLLNYLVECGRIDRARRAVGANRLPLRLEPSANGRFVRAWRG